MDELWMHILPDRERRKLCKIDHREFPLYGSAGGEEDSHHTQGPREFRADGGAIPGVCVFPDGECRANDGEQDTFPARVSAD